MLQSFLYKTRNKKIALTAAMVLLSFLVGWYLIVQPALKQMKRSAQQRDEMVQKGVLVASIYDMEIKLANYKPFLVQSKEKSWVIERINALAEESGFAIISVTPEMQGPMSTDFKRVSLRIDAKGNYHKLGEFVSRVESDQRFFKIVRVDLDAIQGEGKERFYPITLIVSAFYPTKDLMT